MRSLHTTETNVPRPIFSSAQIASIKSEFVPPPRRSPERKPRIRSLRTSQATRKGPKVVRDPELGVRSPPLHSSVRFGSGGRGRGRRGAPALSERVGNILFGHRRGSPLVLKTQSSRSGLG